MSTNNKSTSPNTRIDDQILQVLRNSTVPLGTAEIKDRLDELVSYSQQHIKRRINYMMALPKPRVELVAKDGRKEFFTTPGQELEAWSATSTTMIKGNNRVSVNLGGREYSPNSLVNAIAGTDFSTVLNPVMARETVNQLVALLLVDSAASNYYHANSILPVRDFRRPLEETTKRLRNILTILDSVLNNHHVKKANIGPHVSTQTIDQMMTFIEPFLSDVSAMNRSNTHGDHNSSAQDDSAA